jgi:hypothetical protein
MSAGLLEVGDMDWFWHALMICLVVIPVTLLWVSCLVDIVLRSDLAGWHKALWVLLVLLVPVFGALIYLVVRPALPAGWVTDKNAARTGSQASARSTTDAVDPEHFRSYVG